MIRKMLTYEEAKRAVEANFKVANLSEEETVLLEAANRTLSADVASPIDIPGFSASKVNGYALKAADVASATDEQPVSLKVVGCVDIGEAPQEPLRAGEAVEVAVGALLPEGADAVVAAEEAERTDDVLQVYHALSSGENLVMKGSDIQKGAVLLKKGQLLGSSEIGVLSAMGLKQVKVQKIPMVAVFSIGAEFSELGKLLAPGKMYDLNSYCISTAVMECGAKPVYFGVVPADSVALVETLSVAVSSSDMVITCGEEQVVAEAADIIAKDALVVFGVAVKPGKNFSAAFVEGKPVLCLPSNPSAALLMYHLFARTLVHRLAGRPPSALKKVAAFAGAKMFSAKGSRTFHLITLEFDEQCRLIAQPVQASGAVSALAEADGFVQVAENEQYIEADGEVTVLLYRGLAGKA